MMVLIRYILIFLIGFLIVRSIINYGRPGSPSTGPHKPEKKDGAPVKKVSKEIGEYIDYEEIKNKTS